MSVSFRFVTDFRRYFYHFCSNQIHTFHDFLNVLDKLCGNIPLGSDNIKKSPIGPHCNWAYERNVLIFTMDVYGHFLFLFLDQLT